MHIADEILREVEERKIADIFSEPEKTKVFLQLKELEMIKISESGVEITDVGREALNLGIKNYFANKKSQKPEEVPSVAKPPPENEFSKVLTKSYAIPAAILLILLLMLLFGAFQME